MIVVADTSPINYLVQIDCVIALRQLYTTVHIPLEVLSELRDEGAPAAVRLWANHLPQWVQPSASTVNPSAELMDLDPGERAAITLATELKADVLLVDERKARRIATNVFGIHVTGTLGVLRDAHIAGYLNGAVAFRALRDRTNFRSAVALERVFLASLP